MKTILSILILSVIAASVLVMNSETLARKLNGKSVILEIVTESENYALGEPLDLHLTIANNSEMPAELAFPSVEMGTLRILVSTDGSTYREYVGPNSGNRARHGRKLGLKPGESFKTETSMLFNQKQDTEHLTEHYAGRIRSEYLDTSFAIESGGRYWIKARFVSDQKTIESEPLTINVSEPGGDDAAVWERIKKNGEYAYFLQTGDSRYRPESEAELKFIESIHDMTVAYPDSSLSRRFAENLVRFESIRSNLRELIRSRSTALP